MAFEKNNWKSGDVISSTKLNKMEDGIVEASEPVAWENVTDKPETFTPETHSHDWAEITGKPEVFEPSMHGHRWAEILGKPETFAPETHTHPIADVVGLQTELNFLKERLDGLEVIFDELESRVSGLETPEV